MYFCGIDIAKHKHDVVILNEAGDIQGKPLKIPNSKTGFDDLQNALAQLEAPVLIGLKATGHYWLTLFDALSQAGYQLVLMNPIQIAAYRKSGVRKVKNDRKDAWWIADYIRIANLPPTDQQAPILLKLKELSRFRNSLVQRVSDLKRKVISILDRVFPEYETLFSNIFIKSSRALLQEAATAEEIAAFDLSELADILNAASRGRFGAEKALQIQNTAQSSIGVGFLVDAAQVEMQCLLQQLDLLLDQIKLLEKSISDLMGQIPQFITTIPGIGPVTGAVILGEIGDINRFEGSEQLVAYAGIDPSVYETGQFKANQAHMSKRGSPYLRQAIWQAATIAAIHDPELKAYYQKKRKQGKAYGTAIGAVCRKLLVRIFVILKEQRPYLIQDC
jgi:transposase